MSSRPTEPTGRELEIETIRSLPKYDSDTPRERGVLLSNDIQYYAEKYQLIDPFLPELLKPAAYHLTVGSKYSVGGTNHELSTATGAVLTINPFEVAIIQTRERLNLSNFLIARWNLRVDRAYDGLLWVGAAQVDPGWQGFLSCPIYNLSEHPMELRYGEVIAIIDFVTTLSFESGKSRPYKALDDPSRKITFEDYHPERLRSALATKVQDALLEFKKKEESNLEEFRKSEEHNQRRIDSLTTVTLTSISILIAAVAAIAVRPPAFAWDYWYLLAAFGVLGALLGLWVITLFARGGNLALSGVLKVFLTAVWLASVASTGYLAYQARTFSGSLSEQMSKDSSTMKALNLRLGALEKRLGR